MVGTVRGTNRATLGEREAPGQDNAPDETGAVTGLPAFPQTACSRLTTVLTELAAKCSKIAFRTGVSLATWEPHFPLLSGARLETEPHGPGAGSHALHHVTSMPQQRRPLLHKPMAYEDATSKVPEINASKTSKKF